ncbi:MAG: C25 family cysteine peptidase [candidate division WOR-3 bacterium]
MKYFLFFLLFPFFLFSGSIFHKFSFPSDDFIFGEENGYTVILMPGQFSNYEPGKPILPLAIYSFLLPPDAEIKDLTIVSKEVEELEGEYLLHPGQKAAPFSLPRPEFIPPDEVLYNSLTPYPEKIIEYTKTGVLAGYRIFGIKVYPLQYIPKERKVLLTKELVIRIDYEEKKYEPISLTKSQKELFAQEVEVLVENKDKIPVWGPPTKDSPEEIDYCIITSSTLKPYFLPFKNWKRKKGLRTEIVRTDSIYANYPGRDNQEKIRNFIRDWWQNKGLKWVLLGGDDIIIPDRKTRIIAEGNIGDIPTDMYYADLQWSWDSNNNNLFGEMTDTVDLFHDLYVGRAPVDNQFNVETFIMKDTIFEKRPDTNYLPSLLLPSEMLFSPYHGRVINNLIANLFPNGWRIAKLENPSSNQTRDSLNRGYEHCHIAAHGSPTSLSVLSISQVPTLTNGIKYNIIKGINCDCGSFDSKDCIAESLVNFRNGGCVAAMLNSRYGFGYPPSLGPSEVLDLEFYKCLKEGIYQVGVGNCLSKDKCRSLSLGQSVWRWCVYEHTLFGDPELVMYDERPKRIFVSHPSVIETGPQVIRVEVNSSEPLSGALVCVMNDSVYATGRTNSLGWVDLFVSPPSSGNLYITVTARNHIPYEGTISITSGGERPCITFHSFYIDDAGGNNNHRLDPGEQVNLFVTLKNRGNQGVTNLFATLKPLSPLISLIDSTASYGNLAPNETARGDFYQFTVSSQVRQGEEIEFYLNAVSGEGNWQPFWKLIVGEIQEPKRIWLDHDTGDIVFTVTSFGSFGSIEPLNEGSGLKYPKDASYGSLYYGSLLLGTDSSYIVDRFYGSPSSTINQDFRILDTINYWQPPPLGVEEYLAFYDDFYHPRRKGLRVRQWSIATVQTGYDDWVILCFDLNNSGEEAINNLYCGLMFDFDVYNYTANLVRSDTLRRFIYAFRSTTSQNPTVGLKLISPPVLANISAIENSRYITPGNQMSEAVKDSFLRGFIKVRQGNTSTNWTTCISTGPFNLPVGGNYRVVFAVVGGTDTSQAKINSDSAQSWWERQVGMKEKRCGERRALSGAHFLNSTIIKKGTRVTFTTEEDKELKVAIYDASGRLIKNLTGIGQIIYQPDFPSGIYFYQIKSSTRKGVRRFIILE